MPRDIGPAPHAAPATPQTVQTHPAPAAPTSSRSHAVRCTASSLGPEVTGRSLGSHDIQARGHRSGSPQPDTLGCKHQTAYTDEQLARPSAERGPKVALLLMNNRDVPCAGLPSFSGPTPARAAHRRPAGRRQLSTASSPKTWRCDLTSAPQQPGTCPSFDSMSRPALSARWRSLYLSGDTPPNPGSHALRLRWRRCPHLWSSTDGLGHYHHPCTRQLPQSPLGPTVLRWNPCWMGFNRP